MYAQLERHTRLARVVHVYEQHDWQPVLYIAPLGKSPGRRVPVLIEGAEESEVKVTYEPARGNRPDGPIATEGPSCHQEWYEEP
jgi:hypothetical protein